MRVIIQRVKKACVIVEKKEVAGIGRGLLLFIGIGKSDDERDLEYICKKVSKLRIFPDRQGKMNLNVREVQGQILSVSQFTLYGNTRKGNRPGFDQSAEPGRAKDFWMQFNRMLRETGIEVREGVFGAAMEVELINDGPVTLWMDSGDKPAVQ